MNNQNPTSAVKLGNEWDQPMDTETDLTMLPLAGEEPSLDIEVPSTPSTNYTENINNNAQIVDPNNPSTTDWNYIAQETPTNPAHEPSASQDVQISDPSKNQGGLIGALASAADNITTHKVDENTTLKIGFNNVNTEYTF